MRRSWSGALVLSLALNGALAGPVLAGASERRAAALKALEAWTSITARIDRWAPEDRDFVLEALRFEIESARTDADFDEIETRFSLWRQATMQRVFPGSRLARERPEEMLGVVRDAIKAWDAHRGGIKPRDSATFEALKAHARFGSLEKLYAGGTAGPAALPLALTGAAQPAAPEGVWTVPTVADPPPMPDGREAGPREDDYRIESAGGQDDFQLAMATIERMESEKPNPSVSLGRTSAGRLKYSMELPVEGFGYSYVHPERRCNYGSDSLVLGLMWLAAKFQKLHPGHPGLRFGDLSAREGGDVSDHKTHENGRNADIIFLASDRNGAPADNKVFSPFNSRGERGALRFDPARNWDMVALMLENPYWRGHVDQALMGGAFRQMTLAHGRRAGDLEAYGKAQGVLRTFNENHDDHYHLQIGANLPIPK